MGKEGGKCSLIKELLSEHSEPLTKDEIIEGK
jgi:hypothetical protein